MIMSRHFDENLGIGQRPAIDDVALGETAGA